MPEFCDGRQIRHIFGLSRTHAYQLAAAGHIRSVSLRKPGAIRGRRLFDCASVRAFLNKCAEVNGDGTEDSTSQ
jgi:hypothetical protein